MTFVVYSKDDCGFCRKAKDLLDLLGENWEEYNSSEDPKHKLEMIERLQEENVDPPYTFPQIWTEDQYVGGFDQLSKFIK